MSGADLLKGLYDAFGRGDVPGVLGSMDPQVHWHEAEGNPYSRAARPGSDPTTGKAIDAQVSHVWHLRDGKITRFQQFVDTVQLQDVMGGPVASG
jgi:hypothetical protein